MIQVIAAFFGSIGFAIVLKIHGKQIIYAGIGGMLTWITYLVGVQAGWNLFWSNFLAALFVAVYAELMARVNKAPATIFLTAAAVPCPSRWRNSALRQRMRIISSTIRTSTAV